MGIVVFIFMMALCGNWIGFVRHPTERIYIVMIVSFVFISNFVLSLLPCYSDEKYSFARYAINIGTILI